MFEQKRVISVNDQEHALMINCLNGFRKILSAQDKPTEELEDLILKVIDAPTKSEKRRQDREAR